jgi:hypothetical protein
MVTGSDNDGNGAMGDGARRDEDGNDDGNG